MGDAADDAYELEMEYELHKTMHDLGECIEDCMICWSEYMYDRERRK